MSGEFDVRLHWTGSARMTVSWQTDHRAVVDYAVTLTALDGGRYRTVRVYDGAHGINEMHRFTRDGEKRPATVFHDGTLAEGLRAAQLEVKRGWAEMIVGWRR